MVSELAMYHDNAPYQSQNCVATYLLSGEVSPRRRSYYDSEDIDMGFELTQSVDDGEQEDCDGDELPQITIMVVNERDLECELAISFPKISPSTKLMPLNSCESSIFRTTVDPRIQPLPSATSCMYGHFLSMDHLELPRIIGCRPSLHPHGLRPTNRQC
jgi:hypothetical protein